MAEIKEGDAEQLHQEDANIKGKIIWINNDTFIQPCFAGSLNNTQHLEILYFMQFILNATSKLLK